MPPTLNESALVAPDAHLSLVKAAADSEVDAEADVLVDSLGDELVLLSLALPPELESEPHAASESARAAPTATVADSRLNRRVAVVDRFTL
jgi:hypothetical protein